MSEIAVVGKDREYFEKRNAEMNQLSMQYQNLVFRLGQLQVEVLNMANTINALKVELMSGDSEMNKWATKLLNPDKPFKTGDWNVKKENDILILFPVDKSSPDTKESDADGEIHNG